MNKFLLLALVLAGVTSASVAVLDSNNAPSYNEKLDYLKSLRQQVFDLRRQIEDSGASLESNLPYGDYISDSKSAVVYNAIAQTYNDGALKSGLLVGAGIGFMDGFSSAKVSRGGSSTNLVTRISPFMLGFRGGYQKFFNHYIGTRFYGGIFTPLTLFTALSEIDLGNAANYVENKDLQAIYILGNLSVDILFEAPLDRRFRHFVGGFVGINIGGMYYRTYNKSYYPVEYIWDYNLQVDYSFSLGISLTLYEVHRAEVGLNIPFAYLALPGLSKEASGAVDAEFWRSALFSLNYQFVFNFK